MLQVDKELIAERKENLERVRQSLKQHFIGIDKIIDDLIGYIQVWYLMPELLQRPVIVNLWGMTGVGKTDLVRKLVRALGFQERFAEIELSNIDQTFWHSSVSSILDKRELHDSKPCILLFDEIQRFNTLDPDGKPLAQSRFMDFWSLLSDGFLTRYDQEANDIDNFLGRYFWERKRRKKRLDAGEEVDAYDPYDNYISSYDVLSFKKTLNLDIDLEALFELPENELVNLLLSAKKKKTIYEPINHAQTLVIISGNLDEAFSVARDAAEADIDADIFHAISSKVTLMDVKNALLRKFRPEQVARFGNIHLIYPSLRKQDFQALINREIQRIQQDTTARTGIDLTVDDSIARLIYRNGVFPAQGVRPVFSSITDILDVNLSNLLLQALTQEADKIVLSYDTPAKQIVAQVGEQQVKLAFEGRVDQIRASNQAAVTANISVHEAGHAVLYMVLFNLVPMQLQSRIANSYAGGFTFPHQIYRTKQTLLDMIKIFLAGGLAEELVFGATEASIGRSHDREEATILAIDYMRRYGFDDGFQACYVLESHAHRMKKEITDTEVEQMMAAQVQLARALLLKHKLLLVDLAQQLSMTGKLEVSVIAALAKAHGLDVTIQNESYLHVPAYDQQLDSANLSIDNCP
jgi:cell division protease FtsH